MYIYTVEDLIGKYAIMIPISSANDPNYNQISYQQLHSANDPNSVMRLLSIEYVKQVLHLTAPHCTSLSDFSELK